MADCHLKTEFYYSRDPRKKVISDMNSMPETLESFTLLYRYDDPAVGKRLYDAMAGCG